MKILIDGIQPEWTFDEELTLGDLIIEVNERLLIDRKRVVVGLKIDDDSLDEKLKRLTPDQVTLDQIKQVSFETQLFQLNLAEEIVNAEKSLQSIKESINEIIGHFLAERLDVAMNMLKDDIDKLIWVFNLLMQASVIGAINIEDIVCGESNLKDFMGRFNSTLQELSQAMENNDTTLINDFLEYELEPAIGEFKSVMPRIREAIASFSFED
ncbi:MAG: hypothetical protein WCX65_17995 [bacterium]